MAKLVIILLIFFGCSEIFYAQGSIITTNSSDNKDNISVLKIYRENKESFNSKEINPSEIAGMQLREYANLFLRNKQSENNKQSPDIVSSFRSNIHFAGFWNHYAVINFTPDVFIQPADNIRFLCQP